MSQLPPTLADLTPYLGLLLVSAEKGENAKALAERLSGHASTILNSAGLPTKSSYEVEHVFPVQQSATDGPWVGGFIYRKAGRPAWWSQAPEEWTRQLVLVAAKGDFGAVCASDGTIRDQFGPPEFKHITRARMSEAFIGSRASTAWFNGIHAPTEVKPDAKMLSGQALEFTIDPLGDQTYYLSALRSHPVIPGLSRPVIASKTPTPPKISLPKRTRPTSLSVGVAPGRSRVWLSAAASWAQFEERLDAVLSHIAVGAAQAPVAFGKLAQEADDGVVFADAYAIAFMPPELLDEEISSDAETQRIAERLVHDVEFEVTPGRDGAFTARALVDGKALLATLTFKIDRVASALSPSLAVDKIPVGTTDRMADRSEANALFKALKRMGRSGDFRVYYDNQVTVAGSRVYQFTFEDQPFPWTYDPFTGFDIHREKPWTIDLRIPGTFTAKGRRKADRSLVEAVLAYDDKSLFDWVRREHQTGHLLCDDGAMEVADFVHLADDHTLTLIHVKGAGGKSRKTNGRLQVSVADFEVVAAQAIKNLRHADGMVLTHRIKSRKARDMDAAIWLDGKSARDRGIKPAQAKATFVAALAKRPSRSKTRVIIVQPRLTKFEVDHCGRHPNTERAARLNQLNSLMLATQHAMRGRGAEFIAYAIKP